MVDEAINPLDIAAMDANADPNAPAKFNRNSSGAVGTSIQLADSVLAIVKEVGEALNNVPYVKSLSGVILQIIKIRDEIKANKQRCGEIIDKVLRMSKSIYEKLAEVVQSNEREKLSKLEGHLNEHTRTLTAVYETLKAHKSARTGLSRVINRGLDELNALDRRLDELQAELTSNMIFRLTMEQATSGPTSTQKTFSEPSPSVPSHILPPKPHLLVEREAQLDTALKILLKKEPSRIAILGGAGFGKTTLAREIIHDQRVSERYELRYFLSCEGIPDVDALLLGIIKMLDITATPSAMLASIRHKLQTSTCLLCLDNFETPWEPAATREKIEDTLAFIADIPNLSLIITIRGIQRPSKVEWSRPCLEPLPTLSSNSARLILGRICPDHVIDNFTERLLDGVDGIPLAITLLSKVLDDGESSRELWTRWSESKEFTAVVENGGEGRQSNLNTSIALSVNSPRMTKDPDCLTLLAALSLLPDGFPSASIDQLEEFLSVTGIRKLLQTLRAVALIKPEDAISVPSPRIQMLSPIRLFCHQFLSTKIAMVLKQVGKYYMSLLRFAGRINSDPHVYAQIAPEIPNIHSVFQKVYAARYQEDVDILISCTATLTEWSLYIRYFTQDTIQIALERSAGYPIPRAECLLSLGKLYRHVTKDTKAKKCFREAAKLFKENNNIAGEAEALCMFGQVLESTEQLDQAGLALKVSLILFTQSDNKVGQATALQTLGHFYLSNLQYFKAEEYLMSALEAYNQRQENIGIANTADNLAQLHYKLHNLAKSEKFAAEAVVVAKEANYALVEGYALQRLGRIYLRTDRLTEAERAFNQTVNIFKQLKMPNNQLIAADYLGLVYIQLDKLSAAEALLMASTKMDLDVIEIAHILTTLGWLYTSADRFDKARYALAQALLLYRKFERKWGQANALAHLGTLYFRSDRLDDAERVLNYIPNLGLWHSIDMHCLWILGDLHIIKGQLEAAEAFLDEAMQDAEYCQSSYQQGNILRSIGMLHIKRGHVDLAINKFQQALEFHRKAQWISEQATDFKRLGEAYEMSGRSDDAAVAFKTAEELMESVRESRQLAL